MVRNNYIIDFFWLIKIEILAKKDICIYKWHFQQNQGSLTTWKKYYNEKYKEISIYGGTQNNLAPNNCKKETTEIKNWKYPNKINLYVILYQIDLMKFVKFFNHTHQLLRNLDFVLCFIYIEISRF